MESISQSLILICLKRYDDEAFTEVEQLEWDAWHAAHPGRELTVVLGEALARCAEAAQDRPARRVRLQARLQAAYGGVADWRGQGGGSLPGRAVVGSLLRRPFVRIAALVVLTGLAALGYYLINRPFQQVAFREEIAVPVSSERPLTAVAVELADGRILTVNTGRPGLVAALADQRIEMGAEELVFHALAAGADELPIQTVHTPAGQALWVRLSDQTRVYLDAGSALAFAAAFGKEARRVQLRGQAYFNIADQPGAHFYVVSGADSIEAKGTEFSTRAIGEEAYKDVALVSGEVVVHHAGHALRLKPGQALRLDSAGGYTPLRKPMYELVAFKDDHFYYDSSRLETILGDMSRWYGVPLVKNALLEAQGYYRLDTISRRTPLADILHLLELTKRVRFSKDKNRIALISL